MVVDLSVMNRD